MKKCMITVMISILIVFACVGIVYAATSHVAVVQVGDLSIKQSELETGLLLFAFHGELSGEGKEAIQVAALKIAEYRLAEQEIKGTAYDTAPSERELRAAEKKTFKETESVNLPYCEEWGITPDQMISMAVMSKRNILIRGQHLSMVADSLQKDNPETVYTAAELDEYYRSYIAEKLQDSPYTVLNEKACEELLAVWDQAKSLAKWAAQNPS